MFLFAKNGHETEIHEQYEGFNRQIAISSLITERQTALKVLLKKERFVCFCHT